MSEQTHTPGPWKAVKVGTDWHIVGKPTWGCEYYGKKGEWCVAALDDMMADEYPREAKANARLIAASPDLLALAHQYLSDLRYPPTGDSLQRRIEQTQRVIAKAANA